MIRPIVYIKIDKAIYYLLNYLESRVFKTVISVPERVNTNYVVFTNRTDIVNCILVSTHYIHS